MNSASQARLVIEGGPDNSETIPLRGLSTSMGRDSDNDVVVDIAGVSRRHATILETDFGYALSDLSSTNGTFVNSEGVSGEEYPLNDGDSIRLGLAAVSYVFRHQKAKTLQLPVDPATPLRVGGENGGSRQLGEEAGGSDAEPAVQEAASLERDERKGKADLYEGTVRLTVHVEGGVGLAVSFTQVLDDMHEVRVLRMASILDGGMDIWLYLRQPIPLPQMLAQIDSVVSVGTNVGHDLGTGGDQPEFAVLLRPTPNSSVIMPAARSSSRKPKTPRPSPALEAQPSSPNRAAPACVFCKEPLVPGTVVCPNCRKSQA